MNLLELPVLYALWANIFFSSASLVFAVYSRKHSSLWMNAFKANLAFAFLLVIVPIFIGFQPLPIHALMGLMLSGFLGLLLGDVCLFKAYSMIGAGRTLMLFGFQPLVLGAFGFLLFGQTINADRLWGILCFMTCLFIFSLESRRMRGHWEWRGLMWALIGVLFDTAGVLLTRSAFEQSPGLHSLEANLYRFGGAVLGFLIIGRFIRRIDLVAKFRSEPRPQQALLIAASVCGTLLSLGLYLAAIQKGHLATISGIAITAPLFATLLESIAAKRWPSRYLWAALTSFAVGFWFVFDA